METLLLITAISFGGGWLLGDKSSEVTVTCKPEPLVVVTCAVPTPPADDSFGATTDKLVEVVGQYKQCRAACMPSP